MGTVEVTVEFTKRQQTEPIAFLCTL